MDGSGDAPVKDQIITLIEAVRLSQAILAKYIASGGERPATAINEILKIFDDESVNDAMNALYPDVDSPGLSPGDALEIEQTELKVPKKNLTPMMRRK
jgi:hypothetical protein